MEKKNYDENDGVWRTIGGRRVFIRNGQSLSDAMKESGKFAKKDETNQSKEQIKKDIIEIVNTGQVFDFSMGPTMTLCSRYENGDYIWLNSSGDSPMGRFEIEIVPYLKDEFVVIDNEVTKTSRTSRFKKYGYEVVGEITAREKDISQGIYTDEERTYLKDKWYLMRKK